MRQPGGFIDFWQGSYLTGNVFMADSPNEFFGKATSKIIDTTNGLRLMVIGFMFLQTNAADKVIVADPQSQFQQQWFLDLMARTDIDAYIVLIHADLVSRETGDVQAAIRSHHPAAPVVILTGHSHYRGLEKWDSNSVSIEFGKYFDTIGFFSFDVTTSSSFANVTDFDPIYIDTNVENLMSLVGIENYDSFMTESGLELEAAILATREELLLDDVVGCSPVTYLSGADLTEENSLARLYLEEMSPKSLFQSTAGSGAMPFHLLSSGGFRGTIYEGENTVDDMFIASPFRNQYLYAANVPGSVVAVLVDELNTKVSTLLAHEDNIIEWLAQQGFDIKGLMAKGPSAFEEWVRSRTFALPNYVATADGSEIDVDQSYDVIFNNYDEDIILATIFSLSGVSYTSQIYRDDVDSSTLFIDFYRDYMPCASNDDGGDGSSISIGEQVLIGVAASIVFISAIAGAVWYRKFNSRSTDARRSLLS